jgi:hypothetical protein
MNTIKDLAIKWWKDLSNREKAKLTFYFDPGRRWEWLFEAEIENIFYQEVIIKWYVSKYGKVEFDYNEKEIRNIYLKYTKEPPMTEYHSECVCENECRGFVNVKCKHLPQSVDNTIDVEEKKVFNDFEEWIVVRFAETGFKGFNFDEIKEIVDKAKESREKRKAIDNNVWDEFAKEYSQLHSLDLEQVRYWFIPLLEFGKQHYSLIKK